MDPLGLARTASAPGKQLPQTVDIWEDVSGIGGFDTLNADGSRKYTTVRITLATRTAKGAGPVAYDSAITFYIADPTYTSF